MFQRRLRLPPPGTETFFLWRPRQTGKSTLLRSAYPDALWVDLLRAEELRRLLDAPERLREEIAERGRVAQVVIDEVQKLLQNGPDHFAVRGILARLET
jgi:hypothetical protein